MRAAHVLIVSFGYEPLEHVSSMRPGSMARELVALGWDVSVLTVAWEHPPPTQRPTSLAESVKRAMREPSPRRLAVDPRLFNPKFDPLAIPITTEPPLSPKPLLRKLKTLRDTLGWGPFPGWARHAFEAAILLHERHRIDVVWAIHGEDSSHVVAHRLRARRGIPWVSDFKDPWSYYHSKAARSFQRWATARRLRSAAAVTETCAEQARRDAEEFGRPTHVVYSGYDAELMHRTPAVRPGERFCLTHLGGLSRQHDTRLFVGIFSELARRGPVELLGLEVHQYGRPRGQLRAALEAAGCAALLREHDWVPPARAYSLMKGSDALLLIPSRVEGGALIGVKELEYIASGTPVLVLGEPLPEMRTVIDSCSHVRVVRRAEEGADFLEHEAARLRGTVGERSSCRGPVNSAALAAFTWRAQARRLSEILEECLGADGESVVSEPGVRAGA